jgi:hypothetical protein
MTSKIPQNVWTTIGFTAGTITAGNPFQIFTGVKGVGGMTLADTNLKTSGRIPYNEVDVFGLNAQIYTDGNTPRMAEADFINALNSFSLKLTKNTIKIFQGMISEIPAGNDISGATSSGTAASSVYILNNGVASITNYFPLKDVEKILPTDILAGEIKAEQTFTALANFKIKIILKAYALQNI